MNKQSIDLIISVVGFIFNIVFLFYFLRDAVQRKMLGKNYMLQFLSTLVVSILIGAFLVKGLGYLGYFIGPPILVAYISILFFYALKVFTTKKTQ